MALDILKLSPRLYIGLLRGLLDCLETEIDGRYTLIKIVELLFLQVRTK